MTKQTNYDKVKKYVMSNVNHGELETSYSQIAEDLNINVGLVSKQIHSLESKNVIEILRHPTRGRSTKKALLKIVGEEFVRIVVKDEVFYLRQTDLGLCMSLKDLARSTITNDHRSFEEILEGNKRLFKNNTILLDGKLFLNAKSIMSILMKVDIEHAHPIRQAAIHELQDIVATTMVQTVLHAKCTLTDDEHCRILSNIEEITELKKEDIIESFKNLETDINAILEQCRSNIHQANNERDKALKDIGRYKTLAETEKAGKERLITQNTMLKTQLLDRTM